ncbi:MAG TPA: LacI family DNA-binding transcriptional regulator [Ignavibacteriaceae bacterium]|nr:LacI family DNA-binding transcriptional regulator [Ignavibacteriaceae bacterium]
MNPTIKEIAKRANVSIATVSRALNDLSNVKNDTKVLIKKIAEELNYNPNIAARNLVSKKTQIIGFVLPEIEGEFYTEVIKGIDKVAYGSGYHMIVASSHSERSIVETLTNFMKRNFVDGVIVMIPAVNQQVKELIEGSRVPVVIINAKNEIDNVDTVSIDNYQGAYSITNYLIKNSGYKKIAIIKGPAQNNDALERFEGYLSALTDNNIEVNDNWIIEGDFTMKGGELACSRLLTLSDRPDAIFACNDIMAIGCYKVINNLGLNIPDDIGVAGFDHINLSEFILPHLTTVHVPKEELGTEAGKLLIDRIEKGDTKEITHLKISTGIVFGNSSKN